MLLRLLNLISPQIIKEGKEGMQAGVESYHNKPLATILMVVTLLLFSSVCLNFGQWLENKSLMYKVIETDARASAYIQAVNKQVQELHLQSNPQPSK